MKGKEGTADPGGQQAKSRRYLSGSGLCPSGEIVFFANGARGLSDREGLVDLGRRSLKVRSRGASRDSGVNYN